MGLFLLKNIPIRVVSLSDTHYRLFSPLWTLDELIFLLNMFYYQMAIWMKGELRRRISLLLIKIMAHRDMKR